MGRTERRKITPWGTSMAIKKTMHGKALCHIGQDRNIARTKKKKKGTNSGGERRRKWAGGKLLQGLKKWSKVNVGGGRAGGVQEGCHWGRGVPLTEVSGGGEKNFYLQTVRKKKKGQEGRKKKGGKRSGKKPRKQATERKKKKKSNSQRSKMKGGHGGGGITGKADHELTGRGKWGMRRFQGGGWGHGITKEWGGGRREA